MSAAKFVYSSVMPRFKDGSDEVDHLEVWVHTDLYGEDQADLYEKAKTVCSLANAAPDLLEALKELLHAYSEPDRRLCCDGRDCGCMGSTVHQQAEHYARAAITKAGG